MHRLNSVARGVAIVLALVVADCGKPSNDPSRAGSRRVVQGGDARQGSILIAQFGCGGCHAIPGISNARGVVGPPLGNIADRLIIAGMLANTPENMTAWLEAPQSIVPGNAMPNMGLKPAEARNVAAYLYTLR